MIEWQPIETAPKDGRPILGWVDDGWPVAIFWTEYEPKLKSELQVEGYWGYADEAIGDLVEEVNPSHWMPLPYPPK